MKAARQGDGVILEMSRQEATDLGLLVGGAANMETFVMCIPVSREDKPEMVKRMFAAAYYTSGALREVLEQFDEEGPPCCSPESS